MAKILRTGFGQVELNQVAGGMVDAKLVDQVPVATSVGDILEQGQFLQLSRDGKTLVLPGAGVGPVLMVYNEEYFYDERDWGHKAFAMKQEDYYDRFVPRCLVLTETDKFTTNSLIQGNTGKNIKITTSVDMPAAGDSFAVSKATGFLVPATDANAYADGPVFTVITTVGGFQDGSAAATTMPDGQPAVKFVVTKE